MARLRFDTTGLAALLAWVFALAIVAWGYRLSTAYNIVSLSGLPMPRLRYLWRGMTSDAFAAVLWGAFSVYVLRLPSLRAIAVFLWCFTLTGNALNILVNGANLSIYSFNDGLQKEFILGTVLTLSIAMPTLIGFFSFAFLQAVFYRWISGMSARTRAEISCAHVFLIVLLMVLPMRTVRGWMDFGIVEDNIRNAYLMPQPQLMAIGNKILSRFVNRDLNGKKVVDTPAHPPNVLMITIESLSANMVDMGWTPNLARRTHEGLYYPNFVNPSRRTANGMYSLLCGDYPLLLIRGHNRSFFTTSKGLGVFESRAQHYCLPRMLADHKYHTAYMQPTDLSFEHQGDLNGLIGFREQFGKPQYVFEDYVGNEGWGPNDPSMFKIVQKKIGQLEAMETPWFLTVLTVGTHHPWQVPFPYNQYNIPPMKRSFIYMDMALEQLLNDLEASGILKNTLVLITSDESSAPSGSDLSRPDTVLPENRGFMLVLTPDKHKEVMPEVFAQPDVFLSVADYIGADTSNIPFGRSLFRHYNSFRPIFMGSIFSHHLMGMIEPRKFMVCHALDVKSCRQFTMDSDDLFHTGFHITGINKGSALFFESVGMRIQNTVFPRRWPLPEPVMQARH